jgi:hypothetical protein
MSAAVDVRILRGKNAADGYKLHQFANDWIHASGHGRENIIVRPLNVQVDGDEHRRLTESYARWQADPSAEQVGFFWQLWQLNADGTFSRRGGVAAGSTPRRRSAPGGNSPFRAGSADL